MVANTYRTSVPPSKGGSYCSRSSSMVPKVTRKLPGAVNCSGDSDCTLVD